MFQSPQLPDLATLPRGYLAAAAILLVALAVAAFLLLRGRRSSRYPVAPGAERGRRALLAALRLREIVGSASSYGRLGSALDALREGRPDLALAVLRDPYLQLDHCTDELYWWALASARLAAGDGAGAAAAAHEVLGIPGVEARTRAQAWAVLRELGRHPADDEAEQVLGVVMEEAHGGRGAAYAAYEDGEIRAVWSTGRGAGPFAHNAEVRAAALGLVAAAAGHVGQLRATPGGGWIAPGRVRLTVLTGAGPRSIEADARRLDRTADALNAVYGAALRFGAAVREAAREVLRVKVNAEGRLLVGGREAGLDELQAALARVKECDGRVLYYRDPAAEASPRLGAAVIKAVADAGLPITLSNVDVDAATQ